MIDYLIEVCSNLWGPPAISFIIEMVELIGPWIP